MLFSKELRSSIRWDALLQDIEWSSPAKPMLDTLCQVRPTFIV